MALGGSEAGSPLESLERLRNDSTGHRRMSAENMEVRWFRSRYSAVVHLYRDGHDQYGQQMLEYRGRTELLKDDITSGRVLLRIRDVRPSDDGQYTCFFQSSVSYEEALLELQVADMGSAPVISVEGHQDGGIQVVCRSSGWYPQPKAQWRALQGRLLPSASEEITPEANGLFQTDIVIVLTEKSNQKVSCSVRNPRLNEERESAISIAEILRSDIESEKETLLSKRGKEKETLRSEMEKQKETLQSEMKRQKGQCLGPMGCIEDFMSIQSSQLSPANLTQLKATFNASGVTV
ncbi:Butyrophilin subfamily 1 member A1 [Chelonia mydas]|uniref:Butyrophilin subfamily 1 member A1 n=1 Tax=Chelonia mydas TaxID=8469 RepID=M7BVH1_CHEMY|nr:Butyrophilin subfamily 1 member A1 [Chelonia mydas]